MIHPAAVRSAGRLSASTETTWSQGQLECENDEMCDRAAVSIPREDPIILLSKSVKQLAVEVSEPRPVRSLAALYQLAALRYSGIFGIAVVVARWCNKGHRNKWVNQLDSAPCR
jgi:hypothetical protein